MDVFIIREIRAVCNNTYRIIGQDDWKNKANIFPTILLKSGIIKGHVLQKPAQ